MNIPWAPIISILRHVTPFLGLSFYELIALEEILNATALDCFTVVRVEPGEFESRLAARTLQDTLEKLIRLNVLVRSEDHWYTINLYGLVKHYQKLTNGARAISVKKRQQVQSALDSLKVCCSEMGMPFLELTCLSKELGPRAKAPARIFRGFLDTVTKWRLTQACMGVALKYSTSISELMVFMRCLSLTLEEGAVSNYYVTVNRIKDGHPGYGSIGLPLTGMSVRTALKGLSRLGFITYQGHARSRFSISINVLGLAAVHARDSQCLRALELLCWVNNFAADHRKIIPRSARILGKPVPAIYSELRTFTYNDIHQALHIAFGSEPGAITVRGHWSRGTCPMAPFEHEGGVDDHPSFTIRIDPTGEVYYRCFACDGMMRPISHLFKRLRDLSGEFPTKAYRLYGSCVSLIKSGDIAVPDRMQLTVEPLSTWAVDQYPLLTTLSGQGSGFLKKYFRSRGVSDAAFEHFRVRFVAEKDSKTFVTEFTTLDGHVTCLRRRTLAVGEKDIATVGGYGDSGAMFGLCQGDPNKPLLIVEGEVDALKSYTFGFTNVVAIGTAAPCPAQIELLIRNWCNQTVYIGLDCDSAGQNASDAFIHKLVEDIKFDIPRLYLVTWANIPLPAPVQVRGGRIRYTCKDAGDIQTKPQFWSAIKNVDYVGPIRARNKKGALSHPP